MAAVSAYAGKAAAATAASDELHASLPIPGGGVMWFGPLKKFQKLFFHTPIVNLFVLGSVLYHDYYCYPVHGRKVVRQWLKAPWGRLFEHY